MPDEDLVALTSLPTAIWRLMQFELLRELAIHWLCLHEAAHWLSGHLEALSAERPGDLSIGALAFSDPPLGADAARGPKRRRHDAASGLARRMGMDVADMRKSMEFEADKNGFVLLVRLQERQRRRAASAFARYRRAIRAHLPESLVSVLDKPTEAQRLRAMTVAAAAAVFVIQRCADWRGVSELYPAPAARLLNLQLSSLVCTRYVVIREEGVFLQRSMLKRATFLPFLREATMRPWYDFNEFTRLLSLPPMLSVNEDLTVEKSKIVVDFLRFFDGTAQLADFVTEPARELALLQGEIDEVARYCRRYNKGNTIRT